MNQLLNEKFIAKILEIRELDSLLLRNYIAQARNELYKNVLSTNEEKYKYQAYILSIELPIIIDYIYCFHNEKDTYNQEKFISQYGISITDLMIDDLFKYIL